MRIASWAGIASVLFIVFVVGCGGSSGVSTPTTQNQSLVLPSAGGTVSADAGLVSITLPAGAVATNTTITVSTPTGLPAANRIVNGTAVQFGAATFVGNVGLSLGYSASMVQSGTNPQDLAVYQLNGSTWTALVSSVDSVNHTVSTRIGALGTFAIMVPPSSFTSPSVIAEALIYPTVGGIPAVRITWVPSGFGGGNYQDYSWQVFRNDVTSGAVEVAPGISSSVMDSIQGGQITTVTLANNNLSACNNTTAGPATTASVPGVVPGTPYAYQVQLIFASTSLDPTLPRNSALIKSLGGTSADCYYSSSLQIAQGTATPLNAPPISTAAGTTIANGTSISFGSVVNPTTALTLQYVMEASASPTFSNPVTFGTVTSNSTGTISIPASGLGSLNGASTIYVRVGARNPQDQPGPVPDVFTLERYIFGPSVSMTVASGAPQRSH